MPVQAIAWSPSGAVRIVDQRALPEDFATRDLESVAAVADAIRHLQVRGAPLIGIAAAMGLVVGLREDRALARAAFLAKLEGHVATLAATRPTAVNLRWALDRMLGAARDTAGDGAALWERLQAEATAIWEEDRAMCRKIGEHGLPLIPDGAKVLTHCNAGALATGGIGTALAPLYLAHEAGRRLHVFVDETRPVLQGARLTAWELPRGRSLYADRGRRGGVADAAGQGGSRHRGRRPDRSERRLREQDRHLPARRAGVAPWRTVLLRRPIVDHRPRAARRRRHPDRAALSGRSEDGRGAAGRAADDRGPESGLRRDPGALRDRLPHRSRVAQTAVRRGLMVKRVLVAVIGSSSCSADVATVAETVGRLLAESGAVLLCGGLGGVMEAAARGARQGGGLSVGILPGADAAEANPYIDVPLATGMGEMRNALIVRAAQAAIAIGGGWGTLSEIAMAQRIKTPVVGLHDAFPSAIDIPRVSSPAAAVAWALEQAARPEV